MSNETNTAADTIAMQLGGNRFAAMTGATFLRDGENKLIVKFKGSKVSNYLTITLNAFDLYDVEFSKFRNLDLKTVRTIDNVSADNLRAIFEATTGLYTSL